MLNLFMAVYRLWHLLTELYLTCLEVALSNKRRSNNMADLSAVGGRLAVEVNAGLKILHCLK